MRSSKKRSRSSQNRPRTLGNIINRVFDSSGPEGKVRGTPQQIIEKYQMLARDAQLSNDRVAAENFLQHAEHYTRMLAEAMKEMAAEQEARQQQFQQSGGQQGGQGGQQGSQQGQQGGQQGGQHNGQQGGQQTGNGQNGQPRGDRQDSQERRDRGERNDRDRSDRGERRQDFNRDFREERSFPSEEPVLATDVIELDSDDNGLIETPESSGSRAEVETPQASAPDAAPKEERARRSRGPRKPKGEKSDGEPPQEAAE